MFQGLLGVRGPQGPPGPQGIQVRGINTQLNSIGLYGYDSKCQRYRNMENVAHQGISIRSLISGKIN